VKALPVGVFFHALAGNKGSLPDFFHLLGAHAQESGGCVGDDHAGRHLLQDGFQETAFSLELIN
jgi:hypothetical protein